MNVWVDDPVTKLPSVSLTLLVVSFAAVIVAGALNMAGVVASTSLFSEVFYSTVALYFGRRMTVGSKVVSADKAEEIKTQLEK
jgi:hypothetical protein